MSFYKINKNNNNNKINNNKNTKNHNIQKKATFLGCYSIEINLVWTLFFVMFGLFNVYAFENLHFEKKWTFDGMRTINSRNWRGI